MHLNMNNAVKTFRGICFLLFLLLTGTACVFADSEAQPAGGTPAEGNGTGSQSLMIQEAGTYTLTGNMKGTVYVDPGQGNVTLILDNVDIEGIGGPAIEAVSGDSLTIRLADCSYNRVADTAENREEAAIVSCVDTVFQGCGCLQTEGKRKYGILTENADLTFACGKYLFLSADAGIVMNGTDQGTLYLNGGCVFVHAGKDPHVRADNIVQTAGMLEKTEKTDVRLIDCCREGKCMGCCCCKACRSCPLPCDTEEDDDDDDDDECECRKSSVDRPGPIVEGTVTNAAVSLRESEPEVRIVFEGEEQHAIVSDAGTYRVSGYGTNGSVTVLKDTKGVVLVLEALDLTCSGGAALKVDSSAVVKIVVEGSVSLTNANTANGQAAADNAAVAGEAGSEICITGDGTLRIEGKTGDGIAMGEASSLVIDGGVDMQIQAAADGIRSDHDIAVLQGKVTVQAGSCGVDARDILTIGGQDGTGPVLQVSGSNEGLEANVVNIKGGTASLAVREDGIEAEKSPGGPDSSVNMTGGTLNIRSGDTGIDSDGNINLIGGTAVIDSHDEDGTCQCVDADGDLYIDDSYVLDCGCEEG